MTDLNERGWTDMQLAVRNLARIYNNQSPIPRVLNRYRLVSWDRGKDISRKTIYGNPFVVGIDGERDECCKLFSKWIIDQPGIINKAKQELIGYDLICSCKQMTKHYNCHGDILLRILYPQADHEYPKFPLLNHQARNNTSVQENP